MKLYVCLVVAILATIAPTEALLGAKLALLGVLRNSLGGGGGILDYGNGGGYGGGGYGGGYGNGYGNAGNSNGFNYNRPVYTGQSSNYGWGQQSYGGGYSSGFNRGYSSGYNGGNIETIKVIRVIVDHEQPQAYYDNYGRGSSASTSAVSSSAGASWTQIPAPAPVVQTYATQPVQSVQLSAPSAASVPITVPQTPVQIIQPPPPPVYIQPRPQSVYQQVVAQRPIQYAVRQPNYQQVQPILKQTQPIYQSLQPPLQALPPAQQSIKLIIDGESQQHIPAQSYGPPAPAPNYVTPSVGNSNGWNTDSWSSSSSADILNNVSTGPWKSGSVWEKIGC